MVVLKIKLCLMFGRLGHWLYLKTVPVGNFVHRFSAKWKNKGWALIKSCPCFHCGIDGDHARVLCPLCASMFCVKCMPFLDGAGRCPKCAIE